MVAKGYCKVKHSAVAKGEQTKNITIYPDPNNVTIAIQKEVTVKQDTENRADILPAEVEELGQDVNRIIPARDFTFHGSNFRLLKIEQLKIVFL